MAATHPASIVASIPLEHVSVGQVSAARYELSNIIKMLTNIFQQNPDAHKYIPTCLQIFQEHLAIHRPGNYCLPFEVGAPTSPT